MEDFPEDEERKHLVSLIIGGELSENYKKFMERLLVELWE